MNDAREGAPLKAWLLALLLILPIPLPILVPAVLDETSFVHSQLDAVYLRDLRQFLFTDGNESKSPRGVMLAMSGGNCATAGPRRLTADGVEMYVVTYNDATPESFASLMDVLIEGRPDFVVIQDTVLALAKNSGSVWNMYIRARSYWVRKIRVVIRESDTPEADTTGADDRSCSFEPTSRAKWAERMKLKMDRVSAYSKSRHDKTVEFLRIFDRAEIPTIIVSPPMNQFTSEYVQAMFRAAVQLGTAEPPIPSVNFRRQQSLMPETDFLDQLHVSPDANQPYREWLNNEIVEVLREKHNR